MRASLWKCIRAPLEPTNLASLGPLLAQPKRELASIRHAGSRQVCLEQSRYASQQSRPSFAQGAHVYMRWVAATSHSRPKINQSYPSASTATTHIKTDCHCVCMYANALVALVSPRRAEVTQPATWPGRGVYFWPNNLVACQSALEPDLFTPFVLLLNESKQTHVNGSLALVLLSPVELCCISFYYGSISMESLRLDLFGGAFVAL